jgi:probable rRNA maturation factor
MIVNLQRKVKVVASHYSGFVASLTDLIVEAKGGSFSVAFIADRRMEELNSFFRGKTTTTDVLSFPHEADEFESTSQAFTRDTRPSAKAVSQESSNYLGDIVISVEQAQRQAKENELTLESEIKQLILHGLLHLCGYDHETDDGEMNKRERELRRKLKI